MTVPLHDLRDMDAWIEARLGTDDEHDTPEWRSRIVGPNAARTVGSANPYRFMAIRMTADCAQELTILAKEQGLSRESLVRVLIAHYVSTRTGRDPDDVLGQMPPRKGGP